MVDLPGNLRQQPVPDRLTGGPDTRRQAEHQHLPDQVGNCFDVAARPGVSLLCGGSRTALVVPGCVVQEVAGSAEWGETRPVKRKELWLACVKGGVQLSSEVERKSADDMLRLVQDVDCSRSSKVERGAIVFIFSEQGQPLGEEEPRSGQCIDAEAGVGAGP